jgi:integrase/recombinase XerD
MASTIGDGRGAPVEMIVVEREVGPVGVGDFPSLGATTADRNPVAVYLASLGSPKSTTGMRSALSIVAAALGWSDPFALPWWNVRYQHVAALRARFSQRYAPATANKLLAALRGVLREAMRLDLMSAEACARACDVRGVRGSRELAGRALSGAELERLFRACHVESNAGARDAALLALLYGAGLRRSEAVAVDLSDVDAATGTVHVIGKGNRERSVPVPAEALDAFRAWLVRRGDAPGPVLYGVDKADRPNRRRLSDRAVASILERLLKRAGVAECTPHDMRRSYISDLLDGGADISTVARLAGHDEVTTTQRYDRRGEQAKVRAVALLRVPFKR